MDSWIWKGMKILMVLALKGSCRRTEVLEVLAPKGLCYGMVIDVSHWENPPPPLVKFYVWTYCAKPSWGACLICSWCCDVWPQVISYLLLIFLEQLKILEERTCEGFRRDFFWILILCKMYLNFDVLAKTSGFLIGSFLMEPWTRMNNRERKDYENLLVLLSCDFNFAYVGEKIEW